MRISSPRGVTVLMLLMAVLGLEQSVGGAAAPALVRGISIHDGPRGAVFIDISVTRPVPYQTIALSDPQSLVVDLEGARGANLKSEYPAQSPLLARVRTELRISDPSVFRIVAELKGHPTFSIKNLNSVLRIELEPRAKAREEVHGGGAAAKSPGGADGHEREAAQPGPTPDTAFQVRRFRDLSASLTAPALPPHDRLIPVADPRPTNPHRRARAGPALISGISILPDGNGKTTIDIASSRPVPYRVSQLANPFRLVIDLKNAQNASGEKIYQVNSPALKTVRIDPATPDRSGVRLVAELEGYPTFDVYAHRPGIRIEIKPRPDPARVARNPFKFTTGARKAEAKRAILPPHRAATAGEAGPMASAPGRGLSNLTVIGLIEKDGGGTEAVIADYYGVYVVSKGDTVENSFTVVAISTSGVEVQDTKTLETRWIAYSQ